MLITLKREKKSQLQFIAVGNQICLHWLQLFRQDGLLEVKNEKRASGHDSPNVF